MNTDIPEISALLHNTRESAVGLKLLSDTIMVVIVSV